MGITWRAGWFPFYISTKARNELHFYHKICTISNYQSYHHNSKLHEKCIIPYKDKKSEELSLNNNSNIPCFQFKELLNLQIFAINMFRINFQIQHLRFIHLNLIRKLVLTQLSFSFLIRFLYDLIYLIYRCACANSSSSSLSLF